jgi:hypothetical protein
MSVSISVSVSLNGLRPETQILIDDEYCEKSLSLQQMEVIIHYINNVGQNPNYTILDVDSDNYFEIALHRDGSVFVLPHDLTFDENGLIEYYMPETHPELYEMIKQYVRQHPECGVTLV